jgi:hypothetical protein
VRGWLLVAVVLAAGCASGLGRDYEYEEEVYLDLDGSATVVVNASVRALAALAGLDLDARPRARVDRRRIEAAFASPVARVVRVSRPWRRHGRPFVQIRLEVPDIARLHEAAPFRHARYRFDRTADEIVYRQTLGPLGRADIDTAGWSGQELVAVRLHLPSRVRFHNSRRLADGAPSEVRRGNILVWEQPLADRLAGRPLDVEVRVEPTSILSATLGLFAVSASAAVLAMAGLTWWAVRKGRARRPSSPSGPATSSGPPRA